MKNEFDMKQSSPAAESVRNMPWGIVGLLMAFSFVNYFNRTSMADAGAGKIIPEELQKLCFPRSWPWQACSETEFGHATPHQRGISSPISTRFGNYWRGFACNPREDWHAAILSARVWPWFGRRPSTCSWLDRIPNFTSVLREGFYAQVSSEIRFYAD